MTGTQFLRGWKHFCDCIDFNHSNLDAEAITFMNEMPVAASEALAHVAKEAEPKERSSNK